VKRSSTRDFGRFFWHLGITSFAKGGTPQPHTAQSGKWLRIVRASLCISPFVERSSPEMKQEAYSIGDVAEELAVHPQTLRNWERAGLISPTRVAGNRRVYFSDDLEKLRYIVRLEREDGLRVAGIRKVLQIEGKL
jgi:hypothetical protein